MYYGYDRTSTKDQHLDRGIAEIERFAKDRNIHLQKIYTDKMTGKNFNRPRYIVLKEDVLRSGDCLIITEIDRFGRTKAEILKELQYFKENDVRIMILELPTTLQDFSCFNTDISKLIIETINNMLIEMCASLAEAEMHKREKRQKEGIQEKKNRGEWDDYGRKRVMPIEVFQTHFQRVQNGEICPFKLMKELGLKRSTYYRYKKELEEKVILQGTKTGSP